MSRFIVIILFCVGTVIKWGVLVVLNFVGKDIYSKHQAYHQWFILIMNAIILVMNTEGDNLLLSG